MGVARARLSQRRWRRVWSTFSDALKGEPLALASRSLRSLVSDTVCAPPAWQADSRRAGGCAARGQVRSQAGREEGEVALDAGGPLPAGRLVHPRHQGESQWLSPTRPHSHSNPRPFLPCGPSPRHRGPHRPALLPEKTTSAVSANQWRGFRLRHLFEVRGPSLRPDSAVFSLHKPAPHQARPDLRRRGQDITPL